MSVSRWTTNFPLPPISTRVAEGSSPPAQPWGQVANANLPPGLLNGMGGGAGGLGFGVPGFSQQWQRILAGLGGILQPGGGMQLPGLPGILTPDMLNPIQAPGGVGGIEDLLGSILNPPILQPPPQPAPPPMPPTPAAPSAPASQVPTTGGVIGPQGKSAEAQAMRQQKRVANQAAGVKPFGAQNLR
jgi:hypothetical protein